MNLVMLNFKSTVKPEGDAEFSFELHDSGPGVAWPSGKTPAVECEARLGSFGELFITGRLKDVEEPPEVPEEKPEEAPEEFPTVEEALEQTQQPEEETQQ